MWLWEVWREIALCNVIDLEQSLAALAPEMSKVRNLKLDSLALEVHHFKLLGCALDSLMFPVETVETVEILDDEGPEGFEGSEMNLFDFDAETTEAIDVELGPHPQAEATTPPAVCALESQQVRSLQSLTILRCPGPSSDAWSPLWQGLPQSLTHLNISENSLNDHAVAALCGALRSRAIHLASLNLHGNRCKDIQRLADLVSRGQVEMLNLSENTLNDGGCYAVSAGFHPLSFLKMVWDVWVRYVRLNETNCIQVPVFVWAYRPGLTLYDLVASRHCQCRDIGHHLTGSLGGSKPLARLI